MISNEQIAGFFNRYASTVNNALFGVGEVVNIDPFQSRSRFFLAGASPGGVVEKNTMTTWESIKSGIEFYKRIGVISMNILAKDIMILDEMHTMAKIGWGSICNSSVSAGRIKFEVIYLVQRKDHVLKIFAYITGDKLKVSEIMV